MNLGETYLDHYQRLLGTWETTQSFEYDGLTVQVLDYPGTIANTHVLASLGLTHYQDFLDDVIEVIVPVSELNSIVMRAVIVSLSFLLEIKTPIEGVGYLRHLHRTVPVFFERYGKSALAFTAPYPFPDSFSRVSLQSSGRTGKVWMGYFLSEAEVDFIEKQGIATLEALFEERKVDVIEISRPSLV